MQGEYKSIAHENGAVVQPPGTTKHWPALPTARGLPSMSSPNAPLGLAQSKHNLPRCWAAHQQRGLIHLTSQVWYAQISPRAGRAYWRRGPWESLQSCFTSQLFNSLLKHRISCNIYDGIYNISFRWWLGKEWSGITDVILRAGFDLIANLRRLHL